jgi:hypothetical protein
MNSVREFIFIPYMDLFLLNSEMLSTNAHIPHTRALLLEDDLEKKKERYIEL